MKYQTVLNNNITRCDICPRYCKLKNNQEGFCKVRKNIEGDIVLTTYSKTTGLAIDPVEKKPLYHFLPSSKVLSFGTLGCNMGCLFCQNEHITKIKDTNNYPLEYITPLEIAQCAKKYDCKSIAFTYNDPVIFLEFAIDSAIFAHKLNIKTILVSAGYINKAPREELFKYIDAANIDLKGFSEKFYQKNCLASLNPVLETLKYIKQKTNTHLEITTLLIEGENDDEEMIKNECAWIKNNLGCDTPLHFSAFHPAYKFMNRKRTNINSLLKARDIALKEGLNYVYWGNIVNIETSSTYCKNCKNLIIERNGFEVLKNNLIDSNKCKFCQSICDGIFN